MSMTRKEDKIMKMVLKLQGLQTYYEGIFIDSLSKSLKYKFLASSE